MADKSLKSKSLKVICVPMCTAIKAKRALIFSTLFGKLIQIYAMLKFNKHLFRHSIEKAILFDPDSESRQPSCTSFLSE